MAIAADTFRDDEPTERQPGQLRRSKQGTPYVADPTGATVKSGPRRGLPKMLAYGRPSGFGKQIEDMYAVTKWSERQGVLGIGIDYAAACQAMATPELAAACARLPELDKDSKEFREAADAIIVEAKRIAKAGIAADRGTHAHAVTEDDDEGRDWVLRSEAGEVLDMPHDAQAGLVQAWRGMLADNGLEVVLTEFIVVHDGYRQAGTADRLARLDRTLRFTLVTGEVVELAAGTVIVLDIKSGKHRTNSRGVPEYWQAYAVQIATYAGGVLYDPDTDTRTPYPWPVDQRWGLIAHLDVLGAIDGNPACSLILVDLEAGRHAAELCLAAKAWEKRTDVFSIAQIADAPARVSDEPAAAAGPPVPAAAAAEPVPDLMAALEQSVADARARRAEQTLGDLHNRLRRHPDIDEGVVDDAGQLGQAFAALRAKFEGLEAEQRAWFAALQTDAAQHGCGFHAHEAKTLRRFELIRGLVTLAARDDLDDELIRVAVHHVTGDPAALDPRIGAGHALGACDAGQAQAFAATCDLLVTDQVRLTFGDDGTPRLVAPPLAAVPAA